MENWCDLESGNITDIVSVDMRLGSNNEVIIVSEGKVGNSSIYVTFVPVEQNHTQFRALSGDIFHIDDENHMNISAKIFAASCMFWDDVQMIWSEDGCEVN